MKGKRIVVGVSGGIAVFKAAGLVSKLTQAGAEVRVILTESASRFVTPLTFQTLSRHQVSMDTFDEQDPEKVTHIDLADHADLFLIAPATANVLAKAAHGIGDDMLTTTLLATQAPIMVAPAMNVHMYENPIVQENMCKLDRFGWHFIEPGSGQLACGYVGRGRLEEPETIVQVVADFFAAQDQQRVLAGKRVLVTAGPTREAIDPVRYISNRSSGKMGYAVAEAAMEAGASVKLISGPTFLDAPSGVERINVTSAKEMYDAVMADLEDADIIVKSAAVADYQPINIAKQKIKKSGDEMTLHLVKTPDIAMEVGRRKKGQFFVGFAAETENVEEHAQSKLARKGMDLIVANDVSQRGAGFDGDTNAVKVFDRYGEVLQLPLVSKKEVAKQLIALIAKRWSQDERN
ncbi:bifunctional phosphopantothenoylcysteine decarboxylase/phosphopantothenate--cysteine ligase CoaBC [Marininema halotolerans]|uniref:Coenzyme A biosynthesis bifunctional protein CoaBC n=1 Tax=Marininema halotolerans TaxID=1155944 RepID=A0A1I6QF58_9BACL|nr:bifunctional phosphopantothenoylcysteine decarboxylase/phosphopantothenate--cysteine ligase CoaBC [Marininema halotolerans]SFS50930.1 phosphopantothenoylcysteine decarboxylase / phosphopantothenate--cysteine ligase [Marininema halotolerans]